MTIKQQGGIFGRNPSFNNIDIVGDVSIDGVMTTDLNVKVAGTTATALTIGGSSANNDNIDFDFFPRQDALTNPIGRIRGELTFGLDESESGDLVFYTTSAGSMTEKARLLSGGNLKFPSGQGIDFSATSGTGTSELFDDYEEGTWTATLPAASTGAIVNPETQTYTKVGRLVTAYFRFQINNNSDTNQLKIGGLPFTSDNNYGFGGALTNWSSGGGPYTLNVDRSDTTVLVRNYSGQVIQIQAASTKYIEGVVTYHAS